MALKLTSIKQEFLLDAVTKKPGFLSALKTHILLAFQIPVINFFDTWCMDIGFFFFSLLEKIHHI